MALGRVERSEDYTLRRVVLKEGILSRLEHLLKEGIVTDIAFLFLIIVFELRDNLLPLVVVEHMDLGSLSVGLLHPRVGYYLGWS